MLCGVGKTFLNLSIIFFFKVGFLSEAQVGGYPFDTVMQVVSHLHIYFR